MINQHNSVDESTGRELDQRIVEIQSLFEMSQVLNSTLNLRTVLNNLLLIPMGRMMIGRGIVLVADTGNGFTVETSKGLPKDLIGKTIYSQVEITEPALLKDMEPEKCSWKPFFQELKLELILPIVSTSRTVGLIGLGQKLGGIPFSINEIEFLSSLSNIAATSLENALMYQRLEKVNRQLDKKVQELNTLFDIGKELNSTLDKAAISNLLIYTIMGEMVVNRCFLLLKNNNQFYMAAYKGVREDAPVLRAFEKPGFLKLLHALKLPITLESEGLDKNIAVLSEHKIKVAVPLRIQEETKGVVLLGEKINNLNFLTEELEYLSTLCNQAMISLENARLFEEALEKQRMEEELSIARDIQEKLLPSHFPLIDGIDIMGINIPSRQVGGDFFDCFLIDDDHLAVAIADVSGKGVPASLLMSNLQASLRSLVTRHGDISSMIRQINNLIHANTNYDKFITFFYGELDIPEKTFTYVNAGHNYPYLCHRSGTFRTLEKGGILLGMMPNMPYETEKVQLVQGDIILMYTDGVTEAKNVKDKEYEEHRLEDILVKHRSDTKDLLKKIQQSLAVFTKGAPQADDITMLAFKIM
ncbi:SpoIIE family protein phosphatase [candidate division KSB1 bacterium]|nr:SpoIIE family protein phosphatase [candidate division KSB1 bacterium]